jgi:hypothetical protein
MPGPWWRQRDAKIQKTIKRAAGDMGGGNTRDANILSFFPSPEMLACVDITANAFGSTQRDVAASSSLKTHSTGLRDAGATPNCIRQQCHT